MRGFFGITRVFMTPVIKQGFRFQNQQQVQMRILLNRFNQLLRMSTSIQGLRLANVFDQSMYSDLEEAKGNSIILQLALQMTLRTWRRDKLAYIQDAQYDLIIQILQMDQDLIQEWYYLDQNDKNDSPQGPISIRDIDVMLRTNNLTSNSLMYKNGLTKEWTPLQQIEELKQCLDEQANEYISMITPKERKLSAHQQQIMLIQEFEEFENELNSNNGDSNEMKLNDDERMEIMKKKIEKNRKKTQKEKQKKKQKWYTPKINTNIYVEGLPPDVTTDELKQAFSKAGLIRIDPATLEPKIKIYKNSDGECKGDGLISYKMIESVGVAKDLLNGMELRPGFKIKVSEAVFEQKGQYRAREDKKIDKMKKLLARQKEMTQLGWEGQEGDTEGLKIIIVRNLFTPPQPDQFFNELYEDILDQCESFGQVHKIEIFREHPQGVVKIKFESAVDAEQYINESVGKQYLGRLIQANYWDGKEDFKHSQEEREQEAKRLEEFGKWIEEQQD